ncbi:MAG: recombinase family protein, partial [Myxococcota bacterium]
GAVENRPALLALRAAFGRFDVLLVFDGTRVARELSIFATVVRELREAGKVAYSVSTGQPLHGPSETALAWVGAMTREQIQASTKRGLDERARRRRATGAAPYGYTTAPAADGSGEREYVIVPEEAEIVRRIFADYLSGSSMREIADQLNREGVPGPKPRGGAKVRTWIHTAVREVLRRRLYAGVREYGAVERTRRINGRRTARKRKASEVIRVEVPELLIVPEAIWLDVQAALSAKAANRTPGLRAKAAPVHVLATLLRCGECGAAFHVRGGAFACSGLRGRKPCESTLRIPTDVIHERVLGTIGRQLLATESAERIITRTMELVRVALDRREDLGADRERLAAFDRRIRHTLTLAQDTADEQEFHELRDQLADMNTARRKLRERITAAEHAGEADESALRDRLATMLDDLAGTMAR